MTEVMFAVRRGDLDADTVITTIIEAQERFETGRRAARRTYSS